MRAACSSRVTQQPRGPLIREYCLNGTTITGDQAYLNLAAAGLNNPGPAYARLPDPHRSLHRAAHQLNCLYQLVELPQDRAARDCQKFRGRR